MQEKKNLDELERLIFEKKERLKELACINKTTQIVKEGKSIEETLSKVVKILRDAWQYPEMTSARIRFDSKEYKTANFWETEWKQGQSFNTVNGRHGEIEVFYIQKFREIDEGPFMKEERDLINNLSMIIQNYIDSLEARDVYSESKEEINVSGAILEFKEPRITSRHLLQKFLNKQNANREIFHDLMPFRVKNILLVATLYDAFSIEKEGRFGDHILGEYQQLHLSSIPKVTGVTSYEEATELLSVNHYDLVILMIGNDIRTPLEIAAEVKKDFPYIPIYALLNNDKDISRFKESPRYIDLVDQLFVWGGDSEIFFDMVKHLEDKVNVVNDTKIGLIKVILLVEDSPKYYSRYLPFLYSMVMEQTRRLIDEVSTDDIFKILRRRARPKILLATNYEQALNIVNTYGEDLLCLMTDVRFEKDGVINVTAGFQLVIQVHSLLKGLPVIIQSTDPANMQKAFELKCFFIDKNSETLTEDIESFIKHHLGL